MGTEIAAAPAPVQPAAVAPATETRALPPAGPSVEAVRNAERERVQALIALGREHSQEALAMRFIEQGRSVEDLREIVGIVAARAPATRDQDTALRPVAVDMSAADHARYSLLRAINAAADGDWRRAGFEREVSDAIGKQLGRSSKGFYLPTALQVRATPPLVAGTGADGGYLVSTATMPLIELLRNRMVVRSLGARVLSGLQGNLDFPRQASGATLAWGAEASGSDVAESGMTFEQVGMTPRSAQATTSYTRQLLAQSSLDIEALVRDDLIQVNALGLDYASINGLGSASNQPLGVRKTTGVGLVPIGTTGGAPTFAHMVDLETEIAVANADVGSLAYLTNPKVRGKLKQTEKASNTAQFVWTDSQGTPGEGMVNGYRAVVSGQVPSNLTKSTGENLSSIVFGNWSDLMIGEWGVIELIVDPYAKKKQGIVEVTSIMLADVAVRRADSFAIIEDAATA